MTILIEDIRAKLPIQNIPEIIVETIYKVIHEVQEALHKNSDAIPTTLGVGSNGRISLIMDAAVRDNISTMATQGHGSRTICTTWARRLSSSTI